MSVGEEETHCTKPTGTVAAGEGGTGASPCSFSSVNTNGFLIATVTQKPMVSRAPGEKSFTEKGKKLPERTASLSLLGRNEHWFFLEVQLLSVCLDSLNWG